MVAGTKPSFGTYCQVIREQPAKWPKFAALCAGIAGALVRGEWLLALCVVPGAILFALLWFPVWQRLAPRFPSASTFGQRHLLEGEGWNDVAPHGHSVESDSVKQAHHVRIVE